MGLLDTINKYNVSELKPITKKDWDELTTDIHKPKNYIIYGSDAFINKFNEVLTNVNKC